ncbi:MAG: divergent polysaccharide deacetylase family protein [Gammaproteobacteria bacterium]|nr:divergent polysaccharide deacetylase family protein [Gammaproteobacteria bacterium]
MHRLFFGFLLLCSASVNGAEQRPLLSLVIDDLGYSFKHGRRAIELQGDHTYAIIPGTSYSRKLARLADIHKKEVILHLPLQAINASASPEPNALNETMDENQLAKNLVDMLSEISVIKGVNNHMGSHLTQIDYFMRPIMDGIRAYNPDLYFLDSRTSPNSIAYVEAINSGLSSMSRDVFLDNDHTNPESIHLQYQVWLQKARIRGHAIAIGHPYPTTIDYLSQSIPMATDDFRFLSVSKLITKQASENLENDSFRTAVSLASE